MKVRWILLLAGMITIAATAGVPVPKRELRRILVVPVNLTDTALVQRIVSFAQANCPAEIAVTDPLPFSGSEAREALASVLKRLRRDGMRDAVTVLLGWPCDTAWHGFYDPEVEAGVVNLPALSAGVGGDREKYCRRIERQVMRIIGMFLGLSPCPNPRCVMHPYHTLHELDDMGRNFCPPCVGRLERAVSSMGYATRNVGHAVTVP